MNRKDFVQYTVATTIGSYLQRYCAPWTTAQAQAKCLEDAEKLADRVYGVITMQEDRPTAKALPSRSMSAKRRKLPTATQPEDANEPSESLVDVLNRIIPGGKS